MSETLHTLALEILKSKHDLGKLPIPEVHKEYRNIYQSLQQAETDYVNTHPNAKYLK